MAEKNLPKRIKEVNLWLQADNLDRKMGEQLRRLC